MIKHAAAITESGHFPYFGKSFRGIIAEAWNRTNGAKIELVSAAVVAQMALSMVILGAYGLSMLLGEWGRNLYIVYAFQYGLSTLAYPVLAGVIMIGVRRAVGKEIDFPMVFHYYTIPVLVLSAIFTFFAYAVFVFLFYMGIDHFIARVSVLPLLPLFAFAVPLVAEKGVNPASAIPEVTRIFLKNLPVASMTYICLFSINIVGGLTLIGLLWVIPLIAVANGILFRNLTGAAFSGGTAARAVPARIDSDPAPAVQQKKPVLRGSGIENAIAVVMIVLLIAAAGLRLYAIYEEGAIYPPDHVAFNGKNVGVLFNKVFYLFTIDGKLQQRVDLSDLGITREPADIELLKDGSLLIGDMNSGAILRCDIENMSCLRAGPPKGFEIADNFKFYVSEKEGLIIVGDTNNHRIFAQDMEGSRGHGLASVANIDYPNDITSDREGYLWVSNTFHERIMKFQLKDDLLTDTGKLIKTNIGTADIVRMMGLAEDNGDRKVLTSLSDLKSLGKKRPGISGMQDDIKNSLSHRRPLAMAWGPEGNVWITASDPYITTAGILVMSPGGKRIKHIQPGSGAIPEDIVWIGDRMLVADSGMFRFYTVDTSDFSTEDFGDDNFRQEIMEAREEFESLQLMKTSAGYALMTLGAAVIVLVAVVRMKKRSEQSPRGDGTTGSGTSKSFAQQGQGDPDIT